MKKRIIGLVCLIVTCLFIVSGDNLVLAATIDNTPPELISLNIKNSSVKVGEYLYLDINAEDDISGLENGLIRIDSVIDDKISYQIEIKDLNNPKILIPKKALGGEYYIYFLILTDKNGNHANYYNKKLVINGDNSFDFDNNIITIVSDKKVGDDKNSPVISDVSVDKYNISLGEEVKICAKVVDESNVNYVDVSYYKKNGFDANSETMTYDEENGLYCALIKPTRTGTYIIGKIYAIDEYDNSGSVTGLDMVDIKAIEVEGIDEDLEAPNFISIKLNKQSVIAPGNIKVFIDATDNSGTIERMYVRFISEDEINKVGIHSDGKIYADLEYDEVIGKYVGTIELDQYVVSGKYYLQKIIMTDGSENSSIFVSSYYPENLSGGYSGILRKREKIQDLSFEVKEEFSYDAVTSTINNNMLDIIKKQNDDAIIMIDATNNSIVPASVFEAIKGTNKTIYIESNGYQWVFNGKDIENIKQIDSKIYSELLADENIDNITQDFIAIVFADNGILPGKAKIRVKTDYTFRYIEGYEDLKLYFYNAINEKYNELANKVILTDDGFYEFEINHNSKYVLSNKTISKSLLTKSENVINDKNSNNDIIDFFKANYVIFITCIFVIIIIILFLVGNKKRSK